MEVADKKMKQIAETFEDIETRHQKLINIAKEYMNEISDREHDINHMNDVVEYTKQILINIKEQPDVDACIIGAYWHDVGRTVTQEGHEKMSAQMLAETMKNMNYDENFIKRCFDSIECHKWNMFPTTIEGMVVKDADKIAWLGSGRWKSCIERQQRLDEVIELLPKLKNKILYFECSKKIYDKEIINIIKILYDKIYN